MKQKIISLKKGSSPLGARGNRYAHATVLKNMGNSILSGHGDESNELCGMHTGMSKLQGYDEYIHHYLNCKKLSCPVCMPGAAASKASKLALKVMLRAKFKSNRVKHFSFNFNLKLFAFLGISDKKFTYQTFKKLRLRFSYFLRAIGIEYGYLFLHSHRFDKKDDTALRVSPHFHVIGAGRIPKADDFFNMYGWTYRNHGDRKFGYNIKSTIAYLLSHVALWPGKPSYYWFQIGKEREYYTKYHRVKTNGNGKAYYKVDPLAYSVEPNINMEPIIKFIDPEVDRYLDDPLILQYWEGAFHNLRIRSEIFEVPSSIMEYNLSKQHKYFEKLMLVWESRFIRYIQ